MPTLNDQMNLLRKQGVAEEKIRTALQDAYGAPASVLADYLDNDTRDIPGILAGLKKDPEAVKRNQSTELAPLEPVGLPQAPTGAQTTVLTPGPTLPNREHGVLENVARFAGGVTAVGKDLALSAASPITEGAGIGDRITEAGKHIAKDREERLKGEWYEIVGNDVANLLMALPSVVSGIGGSFEKRPDENSLEAGFRAGEALVPGFLAAIQQAVTHPIDTVRSGPVSAFITLIPAAASVTKLAKAGKLGSIAGAGEKAAALGAKVREAAGAAIMKVPGAKGIVDTAKQSTLKQRWFDLFDAGDARASQFLEETLQKIPDEVAAAALEVDEIALQSKATRMARDERHMARDGRVAPVDDILQTEGIEPTMTRARERLRDQTHVGDEGFRLTPEASVGEMQPALPASHRGPPTPPPPVITDGMTAAQKAEVLAARGEMAADTTRVEAAAQIAEGTRGRQGVAALQLAGEEAAGVQPWLDGTAHLADRAKTPRVLSPRLEVTIPTALSGEIGVAAVRRKALSRELRKAQRENDPSKVAAIRAEMDSPIFRMDEVIPALQDLKKNNPKQFASLPKPYQALAELSPVQVGHAKVFANPRIAYAIEVSTGVKKANRFFGEWADKLTKVAKEVALPLSPKALMSNLMGNEFLTALWGGRIPMGSGSHGISLARDYAAFWKKGADARKADPNAAFFEAYAKTGLTESNVIAQDIGRIEDLTRLAEGGDYLKKGYRKAVGVGGDFMEAGDRVYKLTVAKEGFKDVHKLLGDMKVGDTTTVALTPRTKAVVTLLDDGRYSIKTPLRTTVVNAGSSVLDDLAAKFGAHKAKQLYFDYGGDLAAWPRHLRQTPAVGAASAFYTWAYRATDIPFFKSGLGGALLAGPTGGLTTTSRAGNLYLAGRHAKIAMGRAAIQAAVPNNTTSEDYLRQAGAYSPGDAASRIVVGSSNPGALATVRYSSANWLQPTMNLWAGAFNGIQSLVEAAGEKTGLMDDPLLAAAKAGKLTDIKTLRKLVHRARSTDTVTAGLGAAGLGGTMVFDTYTKAMDSERAGKDFDWADAAEGLLVPRLVSNLAGVVADTEYNRAKRLAYAPENPKSRTQRAEWLMGQVIGIGYQMQNTDKDMQRYLRAVRSELTAQADVWIKKRKLKVAQMDASGFTPERAKELDTEVDMLKQAIDAAVDMAETDYSNALKAVTEGAKAKLRPKETRRQAAKRKLKEKAKGK